MSAKQRSTYALCGARTRGGGTCRLFSGQGTSHLGYGRCKFHGGSTPTHVASAIAQAAHKRALLFGEELPVEPAEALLSMLRLSAGHVAFIRDELAEMESQERSDSFRGQVLVRLYGEERDRVARIAKAALESGVQERLVRLAESYGELLARLIGGILGDLQLTVRQRELAAEVVPRRLLELEAGGPDTLDA